MSESFAQTVYELAVTANDPMLQSILSAEGEGAAAAVPLLEFLDSVEDMDQIAVFGAVAYDNWAGCGRATVVLKDGAAPAPAGAPQFTLTDRCFPAAIEKTDAALLSPLRTMPGMLDRTASATTLLSRCATLVMAARQAREQGATPEQLANHPPVKRLVEAIHAAAIGFHHDYRQGMTDQRTPGARVIDRTQWLPQRPAGGAELA